MYTIDEYKLGCFNCFVWFFIVSFCIVWWAGLFYLAVYFINKIGC